VTLSTNGALAVSTTGVAAVVAAAGAGGGGATGVSMSPPKAVAAKARVRSRVAHNLRMFFIFSSVRLKAHDRRSVAGGLLGVLPT
jgi:hypothetical protein